MNEKRKRPNYSKEFKQDAVKLVVEQRYSCPEVGRRLGVAASNVSRIMDRTEGKKIVLDVEGLGGKHREVVIRPRRAWLLLSR